MDFEKNDSVFIHDDTVSMRDSVSEANEAGILDTDFITGSISIMSDSETTHDDNLSFINDPEAPKVPGCIILPNRHSLQRSHTEYCQSYARRSSNREGHHMPSGSMGLSTKYQNPRGTNDEFRVSLPEIYSHQWNMKSFKGNAESSNKLVSWIIDDIQRAMRENSSLNTCTFFSYVLGGNVKLVKSILLRMEQKQMLNELKWVLGLDGTKPHEQCSSTRKAVNWIMFVLWILVFIVISPIFYTFHLVCFTGHQATRDRISESINLPIAFAVFSENPVMVMKFMTLGCKIDSRDPHGNNIYHYLSDMSQFNPEKAVRCHDVICQCVSNKDVLNTLITSHMNKFGITAMEAVAKYDSMYFLSIIMLDRSCIGNLKMSVSKNFVWAESPTKAFDISSGRDPNQSCPEDYCLDANLNVYEFDISRYENGDIYGLQSYLLQLISGRSVDLMNEIDIWALIESKLTKIWTSDKRMAYINKCIIGHIISALMTAILFVFVNSHGGDTSPNQLLDRYNKSVIDLYIKASYKAMESRHNNSIYPVNPYLMWEDTCVMWNVTLDEKYMRVLLANDMKPDNCSASALSMVNDACGYLDPQVLVDQIKPKINERNSYYSVEAWILMIFFTGRILLDITVRIGFLIKNYNFNAGQIANTIRPVLIRRYPGSYTEKHVVALMYSCFAWLIYAMFALKIASEEHAIKYGNFVNYLFNELFQTRDMNKTVELSTATRESLAKLERMSTTVSNLMIVCLVLRFLFIIHALRLLPGVGLLLITAKKMGKYILQFTIVFVCISMAFATIFYFVMRRSDCPSLKAEGFETFTASLFSTYRIALGYGEYNFMQNLNARIAFVAYTILIIVLMLNMIIAVTMTTAQKLNSMPWKAALCKLEQWDEILGVEVTTRTLMYPYRLGLTCIEYCIGRHNTTWSTISRPNKKTFELTFMN